MMRKAPEERYATPLQVAEALEPFADEYASTASDRVEAHHTLCDLPAVKGELASARTGVPLDMPKPEAGAVGVALAEPAQVTTPADPVTNRESERSRVPSTVRSPGSAQGSDPEFPINLIVAPEPSLTEGLARPKTRTSPSNSGGSSEGGAPLRLPRAALWGLVGLTSIVLILVLVLAVFNPGGRPHAPQGKDGPSSSVGKGKSGDKIVEEDPKGPNGEVQATADFSIIVRTGDGLEQGFSADKLLDAMKTAPAAAAGSSFEIGNQSSSSARPPLLSTWSQRAGILS